MNDTGAAREGGCRCGQVRFRFTAQPLLTMACHCRGCQRMTGSAFSLSAAYPASGFEVTAGEKLPWVTTPAERSFPEFPEFSEYEELTRAYAEKVARG